MSLNNLYIPAFYFQDQILDKDTGFALSGGLVTFYKDKARTELKSMYQISGSPPNYAFTALPNPVILSANGAFQDNTGNDIVPYFYPYDVTGSEELYYITVYSSGGVFQFSREGEPNTRHFQLGDGFIENNFVPNGQFKLHTDIQQPDPTEPLGLITSGSGIIEIASGNWNFDRNAGSIAQDYIIFERFGEFVSNPSESPRYACNIKCNAPNIGDTKKNLIVYWDDVNKFASDTQEYTFTFSAKSNDTNNISVNLYHYKYYGIGGDPEEQTLISSFIIKPGSFANYSVSFVFGDNIGKIIGQDDDNCSLVISFDPAGVYDCSITDVSLLKGSLTVDSFPVTTDEKFKYESLAGSIATPSYNSIQMGLPIVMGLNGFQVDDSSVGSVLLTGSYEYGETPPFGYIWADGSTYDSDIFIDSIPTARLQAKWSNVNGISKFGTGYNYVNCHDTSGAHDFNLIVNLVGAAPIASDGAIPTGFTFTDNGTSPVSTNISCLSGASITPGSYFTYYNSSSSKYTAYFMVDGIGGKPVEAGTVKYIKIEVSSSDTDKTVNTKTRFAINRAYFLVRDLRGDFIRVQDGGRGTDPDSGSRTAASSSAVHGNGDHVGTAQTDEFRSHEHPNGLQLQVNQVSIGSNEPGTYIVPSGAVGGNETRPVNVYLAALFKL